MSDGFDSLTLDGTIQKHKDYESVQLIRNRAIFTDEITFSFIAPYIFSIYVSKLQNSKVVVGHDGLKASFVNL